MRKQFEHDLKVWGMFNEFINKLSPNLHTKKIELNYHDLEDNYYNLAVLTCLIDNQGKEDHTVAIYKSWIYDGNFMNALKLSNAALDLCLLDNKNYSFVGFFKTYLFVYFQNYLKDHDLGNKAERKREVEKLKKREKQQKKKRHLNE